MKMGVPVRGSPKQMMFFYKLAYWPGYILSYSGVPSYLQINLAHAVKLPTVAKMLLLRSVGCVVVRITWDAHMTISTYQTRSVCCRSRLSMLSAAMLALHMLTKHRTLSSPINSSATWLLKNLLGMLRAQLSVNRCAKSQGTFYHLRVWWETLMSSLKQTRRFCGQGGYVPSSHGSNLHPDLNES